LPRKKPPLLTAAALAPILNEAKRRLQAMSLSADSVAILANVPIQIMDLPGNLLARASDGVIQIDRDAAGRGWFVDRTPRTDSEFVKSKLKGPNAQKVDLVTVVEHVLSHLVGLQHPNNVPADEILAPGVRTLPRPAGLTVRRFNA
jgi:hypothetical protein